MAEQVLETIRRPRSDGRVVWDTLLGIYVGMALPVAHNLGLFRVLDGKRLTAAEISEALALPPRSVEALLAAVTSLGLVELSNGCYGLSAEAEDLLLESSPTYFGPIIELASEDTVAGGHRRVREGIVAVRK